MEIPHRHGKGNCATCPTRDICKELCDEADAVANQDYVPQREKTIGLRPVKKAKMFSKSNEEIIIEEYFMKGTKQIQISVILGVTRGYVSQVVKKYKAILRQNLQN